MTLQAGLYLGSAALQANRLALQVVGDNISNAGTPGYIRQDLDLSAIAGSRFGNLSLGAGVSASGVSLKVDQFLNERARGSDGQSAAANARSTILQRVEQVFGSLKDGDIISKWDAFSARLQDVANRPNDVSVRALAIASGSDLAESLRNLRSQIDSIRKSVSDEVVASVDSINNAVEKVRVLNNQIVAAEAGNEGSKAGSLRTAREQELAKLTGLVDIRVIEQPSGSVNIYSGNEFLLFDGVTQKVAVRTDVDRGQKTDTLVFADSQAAVPTGSGRLGGLQAARDHDVAETLDSLDGFAKSLIGEFNKIHSSGQGLINLNGVTGTNHVYVPQGPSLTLGDPANGLTFSPTHGSFELHIGGKNSSQTKTVVIDVDPSVDTLQTMAAKFNAAGALGPGSATITNQGQLQIQAPAGIEFSFAKDTSGFLASMGINTFFTGRGASDIDVNRTLVDNPVLLAAAKNGHVGDAANALDLAGLKEAALPSLAGFSLSDMYGVATQRLTAASESARVDANTLSTTSQALKAENLSISGVDLDEEAVRLVAFQRSFQASARYISTINQLLDTVINLGR